MNLNRVIIIGNVTADPEVRTTPSGHQVANFSVATNRIWNDPTGGGRQQKTEFHNVVMWRRLAEIAGQYLNKGSLVMIEGRLETRNWEDQNGQRKYRTEIIAENMQLGPRPANAANNTPRNTRNDQQSEKTDGDSIPTIDVNTPTDPDDEIDVKDIPF